MALLKDCTKKSITSKGLNYRFLRGTIKLFLYTDMLKKINHCEYFFNRLEYIEYCPQVLLIINNYFTCDQKSVS